MVTTLLIATWRAVVLVSQAQSTYIAGVWLTYLPLYLENIGSTWQQATYAHTLGSPPRVCTVDCAALNVKLRVQGLELAVHLSFEFGINKNGLFHLLGGFIAPTGRNMLKGTLVAISTLSLRKESATTSCFSLRLFGLL